MSPRHFSFGSGDCDGRVGVFIDSLLSTSIHSICSSESRSRASTPSYPINDGNLKNVTTNNESWHPASSSALFSKDDNNPPTLTTVAPLPKRPPLPKGSTLQQRKMPGLSLIIPPPPADVHATPPTCPTSLQRHVELKKKLSERHFLFRPVSEDDQSKASSSSYIKAPSGTRAEF